MAEASIASTTPLPTAQDLGTQLTVIGARLAGVEEALRLLGNVDENVNIIEMLADVIQGANEAVCGIAGQVVELSSTKGGAA